MQRKKPHVVKEKKTYTPFPPPQQPSKVRAFISADMSVVWMPVNGGGGGRYRFFWLVDWLIGPHE